MGTKVAPTYATLVLGFLEEKLFETLEEKSVNTLAIIYMYVCHGDDIKTTVLYHLGQGRRSTSRFC